jgi:hypothetical protein
VNEQRSEKSAEILLHERYDAPEHNIEGEIVLAKEEA